MPIPTHRPMIREDSADLIYKTELAKFNRNGAEVLIYHLKPAFVGQLKRELSGLPVEVLELGDTFEF